ARLPPATCRSLGSRQVLSSRPLVWNFPILVPGQFPKPLQPDSLRVVISHSDVDGAWQRILGIEILARCGRAGRMTRDGNSRHATPCKFVAIKKISRWPVRLQWPRIHPNSVSEEWCF